MFLSVTLRTVMYFLVHLCCENVVKEKNMYQWNYSLNILKVKIKVVPFTKMKSYAKPFFEIM